MSDTPIPPVRVQGHIDDGPHQGDVVAMPWARLEIKLPVWVGNEARDVSYRLVPPWRGQTVAHYRLVVESVEKAA